jgi:S1-C subfamily serine protease
VVAAVLAVLLVVGGAAAAALMWLPEDDPPPVTQTRVDPTPDPSPFADFSAVYADVHDGVGQVMVQTCDGTYSGTGFLVTPTLMATAAHVIDGAASLQVELEGEFITADIFGVDLSHDLALLELSEEAEGHVFAFATDDPEPGTRIAAIGFPLGEPKTLTEGTVSGLDRHIDTDSGSYDGLLQTDTAINPGNSGGPLVDITGQVVGVADAIRTDAQGIGFAVPATTARGLTSTTLQTQELVSC